MPEISTSNSNNLDTIANVTAVVAGYRKRPVSPTIPAYNAFAASLETFQVLSSPNAKRHKISLVLLEFVSTNEIAP